MKTLAKQFALATPVALVENPREANRPRNEVALVENPREAIRPRNEVALAEPTPHSASVSTPLSELLNENE